MRLGEPPKQRKEETKVKGAGELPPVKATPSQLKNFLRVISEDDSLRKLLEGRIGTIELSGDYNLALSAGEDNVVVTAHQKDGGGMPIDDLMEIAKICSEAGASPDSLRKEILELVEPQD
jgi:hypothetical protein